MKILNGLALTIVFAALMIPFPIKASVIVCNGSNHISFPIHPEHSGTDSTFIFDDGTCENGWYINPGLVNWLGNHFPVSQSTAGVIKSVDLYFLKNLDGENLKLTVDVFDNNHVLTGSSDLFTAVSGSWLTVNVSDIPFSGPFHVMVKWNNLTALTHFLGMDHNGAFASQDLERYYDGTTFQKLTDLGVSDPGVFLIRPKALIGSSFLDDPASAQCLVYPNPAANYLNLLSPVGMESVQIADLSGKMLSETLLNGEKETLINVEMLPNGLYFLIISTGKGSLAQKISVFH